MSVNRRQFIKAGSLALGSLAVHGLPLQARPAEDKATVYFTPEITTESLLRIYERVCAPLQGRIAIKLHTGEPHGPNILPRDMVRALQARIPKSSIVECNVLYPSPRQTTEGHRETLRTNGWTFCPVDILDEEGTAMFPIRGGKWFDEMSVGGHLANYDSFLALTHFKGHELTGFGGAIKNIGMGCGSRAGKMAMHSIGKPGIDAEKCRGCKTCTHYCAQSAISIGEDHKARIDHDLCAGCGRCIGVCNFDAISNAFDAESTILNERMAEYTKAVIQNRPHFHVSIVNQVSPYCDCHAENDAAVVPDIGMFASFDPVALDQACADACLAAQPIPGSQLGDNLSKADWHCYHDNFKDSNPNIEWKATLEQAEKVGMGTRQYVLKKV